MLSLEGDDPVAIQLRASAKIGSGWLCSAGRQSADAVRLHLHAACVRSRNPSRNIATLLGLSAIVLIAYLLQEYFDALRGRMLARIGALFDAELQPRIYFALVSLPLRGTKPILAQQPLRDLDQVRAFLSGIGLPTAFLDMPDSAFFDCPLPVSSGDRRYSDFGGGYRRHDAADRISITRRSEGIDRGRCPAAGILADALRENADVIRALGMTGALSTRWSLHQ